MEGALDDDRVAFAEALEHGPQGIDFRTEADRLHAVRPFIELDEDDGTVIERQGTLGQGVQPAEPIYTVADLSRVWVRADVPEQQSPLVRVGDAVRIRLPALPDRVLEGRIVWVAALVDPATRTTVSAHIELPNPDGMLKPGMLAGLLIADQPRRVPVVPSDAVVRESNRDHAMLETTRLVELTARVFTSARSDSSERPSTRN